MADNMELNENTEEVALEEEQESIAMELLHELKENNKRMDEHNKRLASSIKWVVGLVAFVVVSFLIYLYQYDFSGSIEQKGIYTLVDSDGNVISSDITPEQMEEILKIINGENENN